MLSFRRKGLILMLMLCLVFTAACTSPKEESETTRKAEFGGSVAVALDGGNATEEVEEKSEKDSEKEPEDKPANKKVSGTGVEEQVLLDQEGIVITLKSLEYGGQFEPYLNILVENNSDQSIGVQTADLSLNDVMVTGLMVCEVGPGKKMNTTIDFRELELEMAQISSIKDIELKFDIIEPESWDDIFKSDMIKITTADSSYVQTYDDSGTVAFDEKDLKILVKGIDTHENTAGEDVWFYVENNSGKDFEVQTDNLSINGFMFDSGSSADVLAGKKAFFNIILYEDELDKNGIGSVDEMALNFHISELPGWEALFDTPNVSVTFE